MIFVDTNYFLRLILQDNDLHHQEAKKLFQDGARGKVKLFTSLIVIFEIYWVLSSFYQREKKEIGRVLQNILKMDFVGFEQKEYLHKALSIYCKSSLDLEDSYNLAYAKGNKAKDYKTFDKKLARRFEK